MKKNDYLERILAARVYDVAIESPLELAPGLSARTGHRVLLKREDMQPVFSFKLRGAYNKMAQLSAATLKRGVITASAVHDDGQPIAELGPSGRVCWLRHAGIAHVTAYIPARTPHTARDIDIPLGPGETAVLEISLGDPWKRISVGR